MNSQAAQHLLEEVEDEYSFHRVLPLYMFAWSLAGLGHDRTDPAFDRICHEAYEHFVQSHVGVQLVEVPWPIDLTLAKPLPAETSPVLDLDPESPRETWLQALVHPDELAS